MSCRNLKAAPGRQQMAPLPLERVLLPGANLFTVAGLTL